MANIHHQWVTLECTVELLWLILIGTATSVEELALMLKKVNPAMLAYAFNVEVQAGFLLKTDLVQFSYKNKVNMVTSIRNLKATKDSKKDLKVLEKVSEKVLVSLEKNGELINIHKISVNLT
jgi:hypothetical protein